MSEGSKDKSGTTITANFSAVNVDLAPIAELRGVFQNLIDTVARGCGRLYAPWEMVRLAKAEKQVALERLDQAIAISKKLGDLATTARSTGATLGPPMQDLYERAVSRFSEDLARKQFNREAIANEMIFALSHRLPVEDTDSKIDPDWLDDFFQISENIGDQDVRDYWAKLLAKEVAQPGGVCRQTLQVLRSISTSTAEKFSHFCRLSILSEGDVFVIHPHVFPWQNIGPLSEYGVSYEDLFDFESSGLIRSAETLMVNYGGDPAEPETIEIAGRSAAIQFAGNQLNLLKFTVAGREIRNTLLLEPINSYCEVLRRNWEGKLKFQWIP